MIRIIQKFQEYEIAGKGLAIMLAVFFRGMIWTIYMRLDSSISAYGHSSLLWAICILYFGFLPWCFLALLNSGNGIQD